MSGWHLPVLTVQLADGAEHQVKAINPDLVRWDRTRVLKKWPKHDDAPFLWMTFVAWAAMKRLGLVGADCGFDEFNDELCVSVTSDQVDSVDPTRPVPGDG